MTNILTITNSYALTPNDEIIEVVASATGLTVLLPNVNTVPPGKTYIIKDAGGGALTYPITVGGNGATVDGAVSVQLVVNYGTLTVICAGSTWTVSTISNASGPTSATDNTLVRFDGTTGKVFQGSDIVVTDLNAWSGFKLSQNVNTTQYTLVAADSGKVIEMNLSISRALTLPNNLAVGFNCDAVQTGLRQIIFTPASGTTLTGNSAVTTSAGTWARCSLYVQANTTGTSAVYVLSGNVGV